MHPRRRGPPGAGRPAAVQRGSGSGKDGAAGRAAADGRRVRGLHRPPRPLQRDGGDRPLPHRPAAPAARPRRHDVGAARGAARRLVRHRGAGPRHRAARRPARRPAGRARRHRLAGHTNDPDPRAVDPGHRRRALGRRGVPRLARLVRGPAGRPAAADGRRLPARRTSRPHPRLPGAGRRPRPPAGRAALPHAARGGRAGPRRPGRGGRRPLLPRGVGRHRRQPLRDHGADRQGVRPGPEAGRGVRGPAARARRRRPGQRPGDPAGAAGHVRHPVRLGGLRTRQRGLAAPGRHARRDEPGGGRRLRGPAARGTHPDRRRYAGIRPSADRHGRLPGRTARHPHRDARPRGLGAHQRGARRRRRLPAPAGGPPRRRRGARGVPARGRPRTPRRRRARGGQPVPGARAGRAAAARRAGRRPLRTRLLRAADVPAHHHQPSALGPGPARSPQGAARRRHLPALAGLRPQQPAGRGGPGGRGAGGEHPGRAGAHAPAGRALPVEGHPAGGGGRARAFAAARPPRRPPAGPGQRRAGHARPARLRRDDPRRGRRAGDRAQRPGAAGRPAPRRDVLDQQRVGLRDPQRRRHHLRLHRPARPGRGALQRGRSVVRDLRMARRPPGVRP